MYSKACSVMNYKGKRSFHLSHLVYILSTIPTYLLDIDVQITDCDMVTITLTL
jgi:hypothetical protein